MTIRYAPAPSGGDDQSVIQNLINNSADGDEIVFKAKTVGAYRHSAKILVQNKPGITFRAESAFVSGNVEFEWDATTPSQAALHIWTNSHRTKVIGLRHKVLNATSRIDTAFSVSPFVVDYANEVQLIDCISEGSAGLGIYVFFAHNGIYDRFRVLGSGADGFHLTWGASYNTITDYYGERLGDDGCANIGYFNDGQQGRPHHNTWIRPVIVDCHARGISFAGCYNTRVIDPQVTRTRASSILFARENGADFKTMATNDCSVETTSTGAGQLRGPQTPRAPLGSSNADGAVHSGFIIYDIGAAGEVTGCTVNGLNVGQGGSGTSSVAQSSNANASSGSYINNLQMYAGTPTTLWNGTAVSTSGWTDRRGTTMPTAVTLPVAQQLAVEGSAPSPPVRVSGNITSNGVAWVENYSTDFDTAAALGTFHSSSVYASRFDNYDGAKDTSGFGTYDSAKTTSVADGKLQIRMRTINGVSSVSAPIVRSAAGQPYSGQTYGRYSIAMRAVSEAGDDGSYKVAFMLWPNDDVWPQHGEYDFPEGGLRSGYTFFAAHHRAFTNNDQDIYESAVAKVREWHVYTIEWTPTAVRYYVDGTLIGNATNGIYNASMRWTLQCETEISDTAPAAASIERVEIAWLTQWSYPAASATPTAVGNLFSGASIYANPNSSAKQATAAETDTYKKSMLKRVSDNPTAEWIGDWLGDPQSPVNTIVTAAVAANQLPVLVLYAIPYRDLGSYSGGGLASATAYKAWIDKVKAGIAGRKCVVILEPDALPQLSSIADATKRAERYECINYAVDNLVSSTTALYLDIGNSSWRTVADVTTLLQNAGIAKTRGFATNTSNLNYTANEVTYGNAISANVGNKPFIVDTSRNGNGPPSGTGTEAVINPDGRALGARPLRLAVDEPSVTSSLLDANLWVKKVGESDGNRNGAPAAGTYYPAYAIGLAERAKWGETSSTPTTASRFTLWDGSTQQPVQLLGYWNGTTVESVQVLGVYNGSTIDPVS